MKFGIMNLLPFAEGKSSADIFRETLEETAYAEELGFDSVWLAEHHFSRYGILGNPLVLGAAIAERTKRIRIGTAVVIAPFYDPIRLAEDAALVDALSGGQRVDLPLLADQRAQRFVRRAQRLPVAGTRSAARAGPRASRCRPPQPP